MKTAKTFVCGFLAVVLALVFTSCSDPLDLPYEKNEQTSGITGAVTGRVIITDTQTGIGGVNITLENSNGVFSVSVLSANIGITNGTRSINGSRSAAANTTTAADGSFTLSNIPAGNYFLYASSQNSLEKAIRTNVTVTANQTINTGILPLTPVGSINGKITLDSASDNVWGFIVSVAGTSLMAMTDIEGNFEINGIPSGSYTILIMKGYFTGFFANDPAVKVTVTGGSSVSQDIGTRDISAEELLKGNVSICPITGNWLINGVDTGVSAKGRDGVDGKDGQDGKDGVTPIISISGDGYWIINGMKTIFKAIGEDGQNGIDGNSPAISISNDGYWVINGTKTIHKALGENGRDGVDGQNGKDGQNGRDGVTPIITISNNGYWVINGIETTYKAIGIDGQNGNDGITPTISISADGYWIINNIKTDKKALGEDGRDGVDGQDGKDGKDGVTPIIAISDDGYWVINGQKTIFKAIGEDGQNGQDGKDGVNGKDGVTPTISISADGYWVINGEKTTKKAIGEDGQDGRDGVDGQDGKDGQNGIDGVTPTINISADGYWVINGVKTYHKAIGENGQNGSISSVLSICLVTGNWLIDGENTGVQAQGEQGVQGDKGDTGSQGDKGDKGDKGDTGNTGSTGSTGAQGAKGNCGHYFGEWVQVSPATQTQAEVLRRTCIYSGCGFTETATGAHAHGHSFMSSYVSLTADTWANGTVSSSNGHQQWFRFTANAGTQYIHIQLGTLTDLYVQLYNNNGSELGSRVNLYGSSNTNTNMTITVTSSQTYYIKVTPSSSSGSGTFRIAFNARHLPPNTITSATALTADTWRDGVINSPDNKELWYRFTANASTQYIHVHHGTLNTLYVQLYDNNGGVLGNSVTLSNLSNTNTYMTISITSGQTYYLRVTPYSNMFSGDESGTFRIAFSSKRLNPDIITSTATALTVNTWRDGAVSSATNNEQWFRFTATAGSQYIHIKHGTLTDLYVQLYDNNGSELGSRVNLYGSTNMTITVTSSQTYYIKVAPRYDGESGTFRIAFNTSSAAPN